MAGRLLLRCHLWVTDKETLAAAAHMVITMKVQDFENLLMLFLTKDNVHSDLGEHFTE